MEMWKDIPGGEGFYQASDRGRIRSVDRHVRGKHGLTFYRGRVLKPGRGKYMVVVLTRGDERLCEYIHRLVMLTFKGPCPPRLEVCHSDSDRYNCKLDNMRYDTRSANAQDRIIRNRK